MVAALPKALSKSTAAAAAEEEEDHLDYIGPASWKVPRKAAQAAHHLRHTAPPSTDPANIAPAQRAAEAGRPNC